MKAIKIFTLCKLQVLRIALRKNDSRIFLRLFAERMDRNARRSRLGIFSD